MRIVAIVALTTLAACGAWRKGAKYEGERFRGNVEAVDLGCWVDAICTLTVSGKTVAFGRGWSGGDHRRAEAHSAAPSRATRP